MTLNHLKFSFLFILLYASFGKIIPAWAANEPRFHFPVNCTLGETCWTVKYVDTDPAADSHKDFMCNPKTDDDHKGTDFAIRNRGEMRKGVAVHAAMDGKVLRLRDGESDNVKTEEEFNAIKEARKECGNAVLIDHGDQGHGALSTLYCHLKNGSVNVKIGDTIRAGDKIGEVGQSGLAEFPHLHFGVVWEGGVIDPYTGHLNTAGCGRFKDNLWADNLPYEPITVFHGGFRDKRPDFARIKEGQENPQILRATGDALVYWAGFYQVVKGDVIDMSIRHEDGRELVKRRIEIEENRKRPRFYYTGRELNGRALPPGIYIGETLYTRKGLPPKRVTHKVSVE